MGQRESWATGVAWAEEGGKSERACGCCAATAALLGHGRGRGPGGGRGCEQEKAGPDG